MIGSVEAAAVSGQLGRTGFMAYACLNVLGACPKTHGLTRSPWDFGNLPNLLPGVAYTDGYFLEEMSFFIALGIELEARYGFITAFSKTSERTHGPGTALAANEIISGPNGIYDLAFPIAQERMELAGVIVPMNSAAFNLHLRSRVVGYSVLIEAAVNDHREVVWQEPLGVFFEPRDHPVVIMVEQIAESLMAALGVSGLDAVMPRLLLAQSIMMSREILFSAARDRSF